MANVTLLSKQPPGRRCSLYLRYAEAPHERLSIAVEVRYCGAEELQQPPALLLDGSLPAPADGVILDLADVAAGFPRLAAEEHAALARHPTSVLDRWMEEWGNG